MSLRDPVVVIHRDRLVPSLSEAVEEALADPQVRHHIDWLTTHPPGARYPGPEDDPARCWSCGHAFGDGCECVCCYDEEAT